MRAAQIDSGTATGYDRSTSVTTGYSWADTAPYAEIQQQQRSQ